MANIWGAQQWLRMTKETTWGTFNGTSGTPDEAATVLYVDLMEDAYLMDGDPKRWQIITAGGGNMLSKTGSQRTGYSGHLRTPLYPTQAANLVNMFATPTGSGSAKTLDSWTFDHWNGYECIRTLGVRAAEGTIKSEDSDQGVVAMLDLSLIGKSQVDDGSITLTEPDVTDFPAGRPYTLTDVSGLVKIASAAVSTGIKSLSVKYSNILHMAFHESTTIDRLNYRGRRIEVELEVGEEAATNRLRFEDVTAVALEAGWGITSPASSVKFNLAGACYVTKRTHTSKFGEDKYESLVLTPFRDGTSGLDGAVTIVEPT